jgi:sugar phosphate isomerase/epimerase
MVEEGSVQVTSVHNFCPVPMGVSGGHPELFLLAASSARERERAVNYTSRSLELAARCGASAVVVHAGYVHMPRLTPKLTALAAEGKQQTRSFEKTKLKLMLRRDKKADRQMDYLSDSLEKLLPSTEGTGVRIALENLPSWEALPKLTEMEALCARFGSEGLAYWHDTGHARILQDLGFVVQKSILERLLPFLAGYHVHDVDTHLCDHIMPPKGNMSFDSLASFLNTDKPLVLEPLPGTPEKDIKEAAEFLRLLEPGTRSGTE